MSDRNIYFFVDGFSSIAGPLSAVAAFFPEPIRDPLMVKGCQRMDIIHSNPQPVLDTVEDHPEFFFLHKFIEPEDRNEYGDIHAVRRAMDMMAPRLSLLAETLMAGIVLTNTETIGSYYYPTTREILVGPRKFMLAAIARGRRLNLMRKHYGTIFPHYGFDKNDGEWCPRHAEALLERGFLFYLHVYECVPRLVKYWAGQVLKGKGDIYNNWILNPPLWWQLVFPDEQIIDYLDEDTRHKVRNVMVGARPDWFLKWLEDNKPLTDLQYEAMLEKAERLVKRHPQKHADSKTTPR